MHRNDTYNTVTKSFKFRYRCFKFHGGCISIQMYDEGAIILSTVTICNTYISQVDKVESQELSFAQDIHYIIIGGGISYTLESEKYSEYMSVCVCVCVVLWNFVLVVKLSRSE